MLDVPDNVLPYFDFEAYGRDARINDGGHFAPGGYVFNNGGNFVERYHGMEDIPPEHRIFAYPKLNIREQMAAYQEVIDRSALNEEKQRLPAPQPRGQIGRFWSRWPEGKGGVSYRRR